MSTIMEEAFEKAFAKAKEKEAKKAEKATTVSSLPDLNVEVPQIGTETIEQIKKEASERKHWAELAGAKLAQIHEEIRKLEGDHDLAFSPRGQEILRQLKAAEQKLLGGLKDEALKQHVEFARLLEEIRAIDPSHLGEIRILFNRLVKIGRYRIANPQEIEEGKKAGKWPSGTIFFEGKIYFSSFSDSEKSSGQKALEAELRKLTDAAKLSKAASIKMRGNPDLSSFPLGKPDLYYFFSPSRTRKDGRRFSEGHALIEVKDLNKGKPDRRKPYIVAEIRDACGSLAWMVTNGKLKWIPLFWINKGRIITSGERRLDKEDFDRAVRIIRTIRTLVILWKEEHKPVGTSVVTEALFDLCQEKLERENKPIETFSTTPTVEPANSSLAADGLPMSAKFDRKIESEGGEEIQVFTKKTKKAKKV